MAQKNKTKIIQVRPETKRVPLQNLYLNHNIQRESERVGRSILYTNYICDLDDVIAVKDEKGIFRVPKALRNPDDWRLFQELEAQADVIISSRSYLNRLGVPVVRAQDILTQFEAGVEFSDLGEWRLKNGFASRSPDIAIVGRGPEMFIPDALLRRTRKTIYFTTNDFANSQQGKKLHDIGITVVGAGNAGVDGKFVFDYLAERRYRAICMISGPSVLSILLDAGVVDRLYLTRVQRKISVDDPSSVLRIGYHGRKVTELVGFVLTKKYRQENVITDDKTVTSQEFSVYEKLQITAENPE